MSQLLPHLKGTAIYLRAGAVAKSTLRAASSAGLTPRPVFAKAWSDNTDNIQMREDMIVRHYEGKLVLPPEAALIAVKRRHRRVSAVSAQRVSDPVGVEVRAVALFQFMLQCIVIVFCWVVCLVSVLQLIILCLCSFVVVRLVVIASLCVLLWAPRAPLISIICLEYMLSLLRVCSGGCWW